MVVVVRMSSFLGGMIHGALLVRFAREVPLQTKIMGKIHTSSNSSAILKLIASSLLPRTRVPSAGAFARVSRDREL